MDYSLPGSSSVDSTGKNTGVGFCALLQGISLTQELNPHLLRLLRWQAGSLPPVPRGKTYVCICFSRSAALISATPRTVTHQAPLSMEFFRQEYWSGLPFPSSGDLPNPGIEPGSPALQADALTSELSGKTQRQVRRGQMISQIKSYYKAFRLCGIDQ